MCTGLEIAGLAASTAGTAAQANAQQTAAAAQRAEARRNSERTIDTNRKAGARVNEEVERLKTSTDAPEERTAQNDFMAALRRAQLAQGGSGLDNTPGAASDVYTADADAAHRANAAGNRTAVTSLARIDAPFMQRVREAAGASRLRSDLSRVENEGAGQDFLSQLRMSMIQPNAAEMAGGQLLQGFGNAAASHSKPRPVKGYVGAPRTVDSTIPGGG